MEEPHTGLDDCLRMLQTCFRKRMSVPDVVAVVHHGLDPPHLAAVLPVSDAAYVDHDALPAVRKVLGERLVEVRLVRTLAEVPDRAVRAADIQTWD